MRLITRLTGDKNKWFWLIRHCLDSWIPLNDPLKCPLTPRDHSMTPQNQLQSAHITQLHATHITYLVLMVRAQEWHTFTALYSDDS